MSEKSKSKVTTKTSPKPRSNAVNRMKNVGKTNKRKGSNAERYYVNVFKELGFTHCKTSRYGSRLHDDSKIDLINLPISVQIKAGIQKSMKPVDVLKEMEEAIIKNFPSNSIEHTNPRIVIHRKEVGAGRKRNKYDDIVTMTFEDFVKLLNLQPQHDSTQK